MSQEIQGEEIQDPEQQALLRRLIVKLSAKKQEQVQAEELADRLKDEARQLAETDIPELMLAMGIKRIELSDGTEVRLREEVRASFFAKDPAKREPAYRWLEENNHGGLVKNTLTMKLNRDQADLVAEIRAAIAALGKPIPVEQKMDIHHQTLVAFLKERLREGEEVPLPLFGAFIQKYADISLPKK